MSKPTDDRGRATSATPRLMPHDEVRRRRFLAWLCHGIPAAIVGPGLVVAGGSCTRVEGTGRHRVTLIPGSRMAELADQAFAEIAAEETPCEHRPTLAMVHRLGERLVAATGQSGYDFRFHVFESDTVNAWALPNGRIAVYTGLLPYCGNEAGLAAVIGHEIGHVVARHGNERMSQQLGASVLAQVLDLGLDAAEIDPGTEQLVLGAFGAGVSVGLLLPYSRTHEFEADHLGATYMARAGYDPRATVGFWQRFAAKGGERPPEFFSTHPADERRIARFEDEMPGYMEAYGAAPRRHGEGEPIPARYRGLKAEG